ncbi:PREDICTED: EPIDERMAL PATTERNING FACTOR-like protein 6 [Nelumbo nucifera]|uniref:Epidermal patterning factor-like protein n=2 Tax=Nelumbo nucifera TaxID=4432 RepID=A0A823A5D8_NELNU|nr:PREDICTED: EPIDERMAL PATTERNING FACTOR-like protein 6 [Nelumbo nucifera]DAD49028.1 TPA_asm: hypothetical protein HUJ06_018965 [Nelumbo nucifera]
MGVSKEQKRRIWSVVIATLQIVSWVSATGRPFATYDGARRPGQSPASLQATLHKQQEFKSTEGRLMNEVAYKGLSTMGSRPPSCVGKCGGCSPCQAIQTPTTTDRVGAQYANYEPEGWKCKCGTSFFNP